MAVEVLHGVLGLPQDQAELYASNESIKGLVTKLVGYVDGQKELEKTLKTQIAVFEADQVNQGEIAEWIIVMHTCVTKRRVGRAKTSQLGAESC
jgi:hypothetical protein